MLAGSSISSSTPKPTIHGSPAPKFEVEVPEQSAIIKAYVKDSDPQEISYYPLQAEHSCVR